MKVMKDMKVFTGRTSWLMFLASAAVVLVSVRSAGAQEPIQKIEFDAAVQRAIENNPTVQQAATAIPRAEALVLQAKALTRPSAGASFSNTTLDSARGFSGGVTQPQNQTTLSADITVPIVNLSRWANVPQARDQVEVARLSTADVRRDVAVSAAQAYLAVISARRQVEIDQHAVENSTAHLDYAHKRVQGGIGSRLNELRAASDASAAEARLENARLSLRRAQEALGVLVASDGPMDAGADPAFETPTAVDEQEWMQARSDVRLQLAAQHAAERVVRDTWKDWIGNVTADFAPFVVAPQGLFQPMNTWRAIVSFNQPIYEGGQKRAVLHLRELAVEQNKIALSGIELRARSDVRVARASVEMYQRAFDRAQDAATQAAEVLRISTAAFEAGATTNIEVIDAQRSSRDFESAAALAEDAVRRAKLDLLVAMGRFPR